MKPRLPEIAKKGRLEFVKLAGAYIKRKISRSKTAKMAKWYSPKCRGCENLKVEQSFYCNNISNCTRHQKKSSK